MFEELSFDLTKREIPVKMGGREFILREASGSAATKYKNAMLGNTILGENGKPTSLKGMADVEPLLVSLCLVEIITNEATKVRTEKAMSVADVGKIPSRIQIKLCEKIKEISDLNDEDTEESLAEGFKDLEKRKKDLAVKNLKKQPSNTTAGSD